MTTRSEAQKIAWAEGKRTATWSGRHHTPEHKRSMQDVWTERKRRLLIYDAAVRLVRDHIALRQAELIDNEIALGAELIRLFLQDAITSNH